MVAVASDSSATRVGCHGRTATRSASLAVLDRAGAYRTPITRAQKTRVQQVISKIGGGPAVASDECL
jgi:hypothetical protein